MTKVSRLAWFNGEAIERERSSPSIASISFHLGTGVFDGIMAYWNTDHYYLHRPEEHLLRLKRGASIMGLSFSWSVDDMMRGILNLLAEEPPGTQYVRPIAFRGAPELWVTGSKGRPVDVAIFTVRTEDQRNIDEAMSCIISPVERISSRSFPSQTKVSGSYVNSFLARSHAESMGYQDGIMLDRNGLIAEASAANVFFIKDNHLITPSPNPDIFPGITRLTVIEIAKLNGIPLVERPLREADIGDVEGAFLCSTLMEIRSISDIGCRKLQTESSEVFRSVVRSFRKQTQS